jgi:aryl-alcohol dehydrogenase-like predicted oxidoreductase
MRIDHVDLLQLHDPDPKVPVEDSFATVQQLIEDGLVRHGGLSNHPVKLIERALAVGPVVSAQHRYNLIARDIEVDVLPFCRGHNIGVLSWSSLAEGFLTDSFDRALLEPGDFRRKTPNAADPRYGQIRELVAALVRLAAPGGHSASYLAIGWLLSREGLSGAIVGARSLEEARAAAAAARWAPVQDLVREADRLSGELLAG